MSKVELNASRVKQGVWQIESMPGHKIEYPPELDLAIQVRNLTGGSTVLLPPDDLGQPIPA